MKRLRVFLVTNETKPDAVHAALEIAAWCRSQGVECAEARPFKDSPPGAVICALGGDGTVLRAASLAAGAGIPVLGVNVGSLGFLSSTPLEGLFPALERIARGEYEVEERMRLSYQAGSLAGTALNDVAVAAVVPRLLEIRLSWRGEPVTTLPSDGLILATPTGSTAYSLSLGGPVVAPTAECIVATPHAAHLCGARPLVFPCDDELRVSVSSDVRLIADGDEVGRVPAGTDITVRRADVRTRLIRPAGAPGFFATLTRKLNWPSADQRRAR